MRLLEAGQRPLLCFDLENRPSAYWYDGQTTSEITAFGWKWSNEDQVRSMVLLRSGRFETDEGRTLSDRRAYQRFVDVLSRAALVYGHNIRRHDLPMLNAGLFRRLLPSLPSLLTTDTLKDYRKRDGMSASLASLASMYGLEGAKLAMSQPDWEQANRLHPEGIAMARERVESDVRLQEQLRTVMLEQGHLKGARMWVP